MKAARRSAGISASFDADDDSIRAGSFDVESQDAEIIKMTGKNAGWIRRIRESRQSMIFDPIVEEDKRHKKIAATLFQAIFSCKMVRSK
jgi:hypothetical protein